MHHGINIYCLPSRCLGFCEPPRKEPSQSTAWGFTYSPHPAGSAAPCFLPPDGAFRSSHPQFLLPHIRGHFCSAFQERNIFPFCCLNKNMNKHEDRRKASNAPEWSPGHSGLQPTPTPPAREVSGTGPSSNTSEYFVA